MTEAIIRVNAEEAIIRANTEWAVKGIDIYCGDCLQVMSGLDAGSIDMVLCDLPYGILNKRNKLAKWDCPIDLDKLWSEYCRIIKPNGAIVLFGNGAFTAELVMSNRKLWRYNLVWDKVQKTGFLNAKRMPLRQHEDLAVFYKKPPVYNPQMRKCAPHERNHDRGRLDVEHKNSCYGKFKTVENKRTLEKYPTSIISIPKEHKIGELYHPTQKPVALLEWLIKTYTNPGETVLDNCMGSGSTGVAAVNTSRKFVGIENDRKYFDIARQRIAEAAGEEVIG